MRRWLLPAALALSVGLAGCKSISNPPKEKEEKAEFNSTAPNGEASPFSN